MDYGVAKSQKQQCFSLSQPTKSVVILSGAEKRDSAIHIHVSILSHPGCHTTLSRVPYAGQQVLAGSPC